MGPGDLLKQVASLQRQEDPICCGLATVWQALTGSMFPRRVYSVANQVMLQMIGGKMRSSKENKKHRSRSHLFLNKDKVMNRFSLTSAPMRWLGQA
jgi:hypothetical protein